MIEHPRAEELVEAVARWIDSVRPNLPPRDAFLARVAANALSVVKRELMQGPAAEAAGVDSVWTVEHVLVPVGYESTYPYARSGSGLLNTNHACQHDDIGQ